MPEDASQPKPSSQQKKSNNSSLAAAKNAKNDEFYTLLADVEREMVHYTNDSDHGGTPAGNQFEGKVVYCNCDDPEWSAFYQYFVMNFTRLGLAGLITTHYKAGQSTYKIEIRSDEDAAKALQHFYNKTRPTELMSPLPSGGDFRSTECEAILQEADVVITNPPFSLFKEFLSQLIQNDKKFLIIGNMNAITYKETFTLIKANKVRLGTTSPKRFRDGSPDEDASLRSFGNIKWPVRLIVRLGDG